MEDQGKKQLKATWEHGKWLLESNALINGNDFSINKDGLPLKKQTEIFDELVNERLS